MYLKYENSLKEDRDVPKITMIAIFVSFIFLTPYVFILGSCPRVPTSPEMRVYRGGVSVPVLTSIYHRVLSPCPHVPRNESV